MESAWASLHPSTYFPSLSLFTSVRSSRSLLARSISLYPLCHSLSLSRWILSRSISDSDIFHTSIHHFSFLWIFQLALSLLLHLFSFLPSFTFFPPPIHFSQNIAYLRNDLAGQEVRFRSCETRYRNRRRFRSRTLSTLSCLFYVSHILYFSRLVSILKSLFKLTSTLIDPARLS